MVCVGSDVLSGFVVDGVFKIVMIMVSGVVLVPGLLAGFDGVADDDVDGGGADDVGGGTVRCCLVVRSV